MNVEENISALTTGSLINHKVLETSQMEHIPVSTNTSTNLIYSGRYKTRMCSAKDAHQLYTYFP